MAVFHWQYLKGRCLNGPLAGILDTMENLWEFFIDKVRRNLHIVLCFSPVGDKFRIRARQFPGLVNCTMFDCFHGWPNEALVNVATRFLAEVPNVEVSQCWRGVALERARKGCAEGAKPHACMHTGAHKGCAEGAKAHALMRARTFTRARTLAHAHTHTHTHTEVLWCERLR